jgi:drug/metabolite transporter (DMT)-like permease
MSASVLLFLGDVPPFQLSATIMFATAFISFARGMLNKNFRFVFQYKKHWFWGALFFTGSEVSYYTAFYFAPPVQIDLINYLWPIMVIVFNFVRYRKKDKYLVLSALVGFLGVYSIFAPQMELFHLFSREGFGYLLALLGAVFWACYILYHKNHGHLPNEMVGIYAFMGGCFCFFMHTALEPHYFPNPFEMSMLILMCFGIAGTAYLLWDIAIKKGQIEFLSICSYFTPLCSIFFLYFFQNVAFTWSIVVSTTLILTSAITAYLRLRTISKKRSDDPALL